jgi:hypothetical protein
MCAAAPRLPVPPRADTPAGLRTPRAQFKSKGWFVVALLPLDPGYDLEELGLVAGHAYGVLDARQVTPAAGSAPVQLLQLRNPWGRFEWKGEYGPGSALWTPEARAQMKGAEVDDKGDACFWMKTQDFSKYFAGVQICRASRGWLHTSEDVRMRPGRVTVLTLTVHGDKPVTLDISLLQSDRRMHYSTPEYNADSFEYLGVRIMVLAAETSEVLQHWPLTQQRDVWVEVKHLLPGKYWVLVETDWDGSARPDAKPDKHGDPGITIGVATLSDGEVELLTPRHCPSIDGGMIKEAALRYMCSTEQSPKDTVTYDLLFPGAARHASKLSKVCAAVARACTPRCAALTRLPFADVLRDARYVCVVLEEQEPQAAPDGAAAVRAGEHGHRRRAAGHHGGDHHAGAGAESPADAAPAQGARARSG